MPELIRFSVSTATTILTQSQRNAISPAGPEGTIGQVKLANGNYVRIYGGMTSIAVIVGGIKCVGTYDSIASVSSAAAPIANRPGNISYIEPGQTIINPNDGSWLSVTHSEQWPTAPNNYWSYASLIRSTDEGANWTFIGHIVKPQFPFDASYNGPPGFDIGNGTLIPVGNYVYCYYRETYTATPSGPYPICVARCLATDLYASSITGTVGTWFKYRNGAWNEDPLTGQGSSVINYSTNYIFWPAVIIHAPTGTLIMAIQGHSTNTADPTSYLLQSRDGINWSSPTLVVNTGSNTAYPGLRFKGYTNEYSGSGILDLWTPEVITYWSNVFVKRRSITLKLGCPRSRTNRFRGGPACAVMR